jgi:SpoVK/Ycf46/Vps4 family AAA+-type ATPase
MDQSLTSIECVAELVKKPLISLTSSDLGTEPEAVEQRLLRWFDLANVWNAVLLIDEADVFLERRSSSDLRRNNLVVIFLRTLEYYRGILFLTTNRVGTFDEAFLSRIDVAVYFPPLSSESRVRLWSTFISKLENERRGEIRVGTDFKSYIRNDRDLLNLQLNGRDALPCLMPFFPSRPSFPRAPFSLTPSYTSSGQH